MIPSTAPKGGKSRNMQVNQIKAAGSLMCVILRHRNAKAHYKTETETMFISMYPSYMYIVLLVKVSDVLLYVFSCSIQCEYHVLYFEM